MVYCKITLSYKKMSTSQLISDLRAFNNQDANKHLDCLMRKYVYTAPETRPRLLWLGDGMRKGLVDICREYFPDNNDVFKIFNTARQAADNGVFMYNNDISCIHNTVKEILTYSH